MDNSRSDVEHFKIFRQEKGVSAGNGVRKHFSARDGPVFLSLRRLIVA
jgi:hypothetical protein